MTGIVVLNQLKCVDIPKYIVSPSLTAILGPVRLMIACEIRTTLDTLPDDDVKVITNASARRSRSALR